MFKNYFIAALRHIRRQKAHTAINLAGLTLGLAGFLLIGLWVADELSFDRFHENKDRIYRVLNKTSDGTLVPSPTYALAPALKRDYPEVEEAARVWPWTSSLVRHGSKQFEEDRICLVDPGFLRMFTFPMISGNKDNALADKNAIVLTAGAARKYFGTGDPLGKVLVLDQFGIDFTVTGVIADVPANSHIQFDFLVRVEHLGEDRLARWEEWTGPCYVLLRPGVSAEAFTAKIAGIYKKYENPNADYVPVLQPLTRVRLYEAGRASGLQRVVFFSLVALLVLVIACVNFMNLATARSSLRAREVGIRKVVGARRPQLVRQFLTEALLLSALAMLLAVALVEAVLPAFNRFSGKELALVSKVGFPMILSLIGIVFATGLLAGIYPAVVLSSGSALDALVVRRTRFGARGAAVRKGLIVFQFAISVGLITCTLVAARQMRHIRTLDIGLDRKDVVILLNNPRLQPKFDAFREDLLRSPAIRSVTSGAQGPTWVGENIGITWSGRPGDDPLPVDYTVVDYDFFETFGMTLTRGRAFSRRHPDDEASACVINEAAAKELGGADPLGRTITMNHPAWPASFRTARIIGVVKDFNARSLHTPIRPFVFRMYKPWHQYAFIKIDGARASEALARIEDAFRRHSPDYPYRTLFYDEAYNRQYASERVTGTLFAGFGAFSVLLSCLGLFGLASFTAERRTKEIGIRKVLGGSVLGIIVMTTREFMKWVVLAHAIGWPAAYLVMSRWLGQFAYRATIGPAVFLASAGLTLAVSLLAVIHQAVRAGLADPVKTIRYE